MIKREEEEEFLATFPFEGKLCYDNNNNNKTMSTGKKKQWAYHGPSLAQCFIHP